MAETRPVPGLSDPPAIVGMESPAVDHLQWNTETTRLGVRGVNLAKSRAFLDGKELARLTNGVTRQEGGIITRLGMNPFLYSGTQIHSIERMNDPNDAAVESFWGIDATFARGTSGVPTVLEAGFSGKPLSFTPWQSLQSGEPWLYVADSVKMRKASRTSPSLQIGLPKATGPSSVTVSTALITPIAAFDSSDNTQAANWTPFQGPDAKEKGGVCDPPVLYDATGIDGGGAVNMATIPGSATTGYICSMSIAKAMNLNLVGGQPSTDEDIISFALRIQLPKQIKEVRLYFVCSPFTAGFIPGSEPDKVHPAGANQAAYVRPLRSSDYADFIGGQSTGLEASANVRSADFLGGFNDPSTLQAPSVSSSSLAGSDTWTQYGSITGGTTPQDPAVRIPLRKSDFLRIGTAGQAGTDWATITGIVIAVITKNAVPVTLGFDNSFLTGGKNVDSSEPDAQPFDYRVTNVDRRTGAESNPSDVFPDTQRYNALRQSIAIQPVAVGDANFYQRAWRRGGSLVENWYFVADNKAGADGSVITDNTSDTTASASGTVEIDNDQPVTTATDSGATVLNAPLTFLFGPLDGYLLGGGDNYRPGDLYWSKRSAPDAWPPANHTPCCPPAETLMNGCLWASQGFVFSQQRLYAVQVNLSDQGQISTSPTDCAEGLAGRMGLAVGPGGIFFVSKDAVRVTQGSISKVISDNIRPLFEGRAVDGYNPIDFGHPDSIRLAVVGTDLWFGFLDSSATRVWWVYSILYDTWRFVNFAYPISCVYAAPTNGIVPGGIGTILGGLSSGRAYLHTGYTDDGTPISVNWRTGALYSEFRAEKLLGDVQLWGLFPNTNVTLTPYRNNEVLAGTPFSIVGGPAYGRLLFDSFGDTPQHAQSVSIDVAWAAPDSASPACDLYGVSIVPQPEITILRATTWHPVNPSGEGYCYGGWIDSHTAGEDITVLVEGLRNGVLSTLATLTVNSNNGRRKWFSWAARHIDMIRLRPVTDCGQWMLFGQGWLSRPSPPRITGWDSDFENLGDTYYTGLDLEVDTGGVDKRVSVEVDGTTLFDPATNLSYWTINADGQRLVHITLPWGRGHVYRFFSADGVFGQVYSHKWLVAGEPGEQANWNQNFTIAGTHADKWLKGILLECDTFGQTKMVNVEVDGVGVLGGPFPVVADGRKVVQVSFPQVLGRVFRIFPADNFPGRLYTSGWLFDQEPYQLTRFETQEIRNGFDQWHMCTYGQVTYKAASAVTMTVLVYGQDGTLLATDTYSFAATGSPPQKAMAVYRPQARKGVLYKYTFTSSQGFWLYREESYLEFQGWTGGKREKVKPFGNDDLDSTRSMTLAEGAAERAGGLADLSKSLGL